MLFEFNRILIHLEVKSIYNSEKLFRDKNVLEGENGTDIIRSRGVIR